MPSHFFILWAGNLYLIAALLSLVAAGWMGMLPGRRQEVVPVQIRKPLECLPHTVEMK